MSQDVQILAADFARRHNLAELGLQHLDQYFRPWAILEDYFQAAVNRIEGMNLVLHVAESRSQAQGEERRANREDYQVTDGIAVLRIQNEMMKYRSSLSNVTSTVQMRRQIRAAKADPEVRGLLLVIESPGGTSAGTGDLAAEVAAFAASKPLYAYVEDLAGSAAYWVASQANRIYSNATALVGSIGTYSVLQDTSGVASELRVKVHVVRAGAMKGAGTPGTEITPEHLAEVQRVITDLNEHFLTAVAAGRRLSLDRVRELGDGRVHVGAKAAELGLTDGVLSYQDAFAELVQRSRRSAAKSSPRPPTLRRSKPMSADHDSGAVLETTTLQPRAATYSELKAGLPGADAEFLCRQLEANATLGQAQTAFMAEQRRQLDAAKAEAAQAKQEAAQAKQQADQEAAKTAGGIGHLATGKTAGGDAASDADGDPVAAFGSAVGELVKGGMSRAEAAIAAAAANPALHKAYLLATNPTKLAKRLISEKLD